MPDFLLKRWESFIRSFLPSAATDKVQVRVEGYDSDRVLILGDGGAVGWGVDSQDDALLGTLARELSRLSGRGTIVDLVADPFMTAQRAAELVRDLLVWRYDYAFISLGMTDTTRFTSVATWRRELSKLLTFVHDELAVDAHIVVTNIPPIAEVKEVTWPFSTMAGRRADALNEVTVELCAQLPNARYVEIGVLIPSAIKNSYELLAAQLAGSLTRALNDEAHIEGIRRRQETGSSAADASPRDNLGRVVGLVKRAFTIEDASIAVLEGDRQWRIDSAGTSLAEFPGSSAFGDSELASNDVIIVRDTRKDRRFRAGPIIAGDSNVRFYAGFPIESPNGVRVGNLCVTHSARRPKGSDVDVVALAELSKIALLDLWQYLPGPLEPLGERLAP